jgi:hypothetical protein
MKRIRSIGALAAVVLSISACSSSAQIAGGLAPNVPTAPTGYRVRPNDVVGGGHKRMLLVRMGDVALPNGVNLTQVNLGIDAIYVTDTVGNHATVAQYTSPHVVNVLAYQDGSTTQIASGSVPTVTYSSMTIIVDAKSSSIVTATGTKVPISFLSFADKSSAGFGAATTTAAASSSSVALTFKRTFAVAESSTTTPSLDVDFNAFESILPTAYTSSWWTTRASLSVAQPGLEGMITGQVVNASRKAVHNAVIVAFDASGNAVASSFTDSSGNFLLHTLPAGTYRLTVYNSYTTAAGWHVAASGNTKSNPSIAGPAKVQVVAGRTAFVPAIAD